MIHPTALIDKDAELGNDVQVGAYAVIGAGVKLSDCCKIGTHTVIEGNTTIGKNNHISSFVSLGCKPQIFRHKKIKPTMLEIGANNDIHEYCTISSGAYNNATHIGDNNLFMAYSHIGHDSHLGSNIVMANGATAAGHVVIENYAFISACVQMQPFCIVGAHAFIDCRSYCTKDIPPYMFIAKSQTNRKITVLGLNIKGLRQRGFSDDDIKSLKRAHKILYGSHLPLSEKCLQLESEGIDNDHVQHLSKFMQNSKLGVVY